MAEDAIKETVNATQKKKEKKANSVVKFFRDLKGEFKKIVWPSKKQIFNNTTFYFNNTYIVYSQRWIHSPRNII